MICNKIRLLRQFLYAGGRYQTAQPLILHLPIQFPHVHMHNTRGANTAKLHGTNTMDTQAPILCISHYLRHTPNRFFSTPFPLSHIQNLELAFVIPLLQEQQDLEVYSFEYTDIPKMTFIPHHAGR
jgi:hypothetical protein